MSIVFFGASVTQQKNGYAHQIKSKMKNADIHVCGYGGNHLNDAGICFIDKILVFKPKYCFLDFFSTGYTKINEKTIDYLDTIVYKFTRNHCKLIFLFLLDQDHKNRIPYYTFLKEYLNKNKLFYIDINEYLTISAELIRDSVHTTDLGGTKYAEIIYDKFQKEQHNIVFPDTIVETNFINIKSLIINKSFTNFVLLKGNCTIVAFYLTIGPKSGVIQVDQEKYIIWDQWCHYQRDHFNMNNINVTNQLKLEILKDNVDTSKCRQIYDFKNIEKELYIKQIFYVGESLSLELRHDFINAEKVLKFLVAYAFFRAILFLIYLWLNG